MISDEGFTNASPSLILIDPSWKTTLIDDKIDDGVNKLDYAKKIGKIGWLSIKMRPDIATIVSKLQRRTSSLRKEDINAYKELLRYLLGTINLSIPFRRDPTKGLKGFVDSLYANAEHRKSTEGYI